MALDSDKVAAQLDKEDELWFAALESEAEFWRDRMTYWDERCHEVKSAHSLDWARYDYDDAKRKLDYALLERMRDAADYCHARWDERRSTIENERGRKRAKPAVKIHGGAAVAATTGRGELFKEFISMFRRRSP